MNCEIVTEKLEDYFDRFASEDELEAIETHLNTCGSCAQNVEEHRNYLSMIQRFDVEPLTSGEIARFLRKAKSTASEQSVIRAQHMFFTKGFVAASVLVFAVFLGNQLIQQTPVNDTVTITQQTLDDNTETTSKVLQGLHEVNVVIYVPRNMMGVELVLELPDYIAIDGLEELQNISWTTDLLQGANQLLLPIFIQPGVDLNRTHTIAATIGYKNESRTFQLQVDLNTIQDSKQGANLSLHNQFINTSI